MVEAQGFTVADGVLTPPTDGTPTMAVPSELLPGCPHCGRPMTMNLRCDDKFAEDEAGTPRRSGTKISSVRGTDKSSSF